MAKSSTSYSKENKAPKSNSRKGRPNNRTLMLNALKDAGTTEEQFYMNLVKSAEDESSPSHSVARQEIMKRLAPADKATLPTYDFQFPKNGTIVEKADAIVNAVGQGIIPADVAKYFVDIIEARAAIEEKEELAERVAKLEEMLNGNAV